MSGGAQPRARRPDANGPPRTPGAPSTDVETPPHVALRSLGKQRLYSAINVAGLAIGLACCLVALAYTADERAYDRHLPVLDGLYRVHETFGDRVEVARLRRCRGARLGVSLLAVAVQTLRAATADPVRALRTE